MFAGIADILSGIGLAQMAWIWLVVVFAAVMRAFTGFGFALTAVPVFSLLMPPTQAVVLSASLTLGVGLTTLGTFWGRYPLRAMAPLVGAAAVGTMIGASLLTAIPADRFLLWVGLLVILACLGLTLYRPQPQPARRRWGVLTGIASGLMNGLFAIPGPPVIVYAMATESEAARSRALLMTFFLLSAVVALASYAVAGFVTETSPWLFLLAFPAMYFGDKLGYRLFHRFGTAGYRRVALVVLFGVGASITLRALGG